MHNDIMSRLRKAGVHASIYGRFAYDPINATDIDIAIADDKDHTYLSAIEGMTYDHPYNEEYDGECVVDFIEWKDKQTKKTIQGVVFSPQWFPVAIAANNTIGSIYMNTNVEFESARSLHSLTHTKEGRHAIFATIECAMKNYMDELAKGGAK